MNLIFGCDLNFLMYLNFFKWINIEILKELIIRNYFFWIREVDYLVFFFDILGLRVFGEKGERIFYSRRVIR